MVGEERCELSQTLEVIMAESIKTSVGKAGDKIAETASKVGQQD